MQASCGWNSNVCENSRPNADVETRERTMSQILKHGITSSALFHCSTSSSRLFPHLFSIQFRLSQFILNFTPQSPSSFNSKHHFLDTIISKLLLPQLHLRWVVPRVWWSSCASLVSFSFFEELHPMCVRMVGDVTYSSYVCEPGTRSLLYVGTSIKSRLFFRLFCRSGSVTWPKR